MVFVMCGLITCIQNGNGLSKRNISGVAKLQINESRVAFWRFWPILFIGNISRAYYGAIVANVKVIGFVHIF